MRVANRKWVAFVYTALMICGWQKAVAATVVDAQISNLGDTTHLEFGGKSQWDYDLQKKSVKQKTIVEMTVPVVSPDGVQELQNFNSPLVKSVKVRHGGPDGKDIVIFELSSADVEAFDYLTEKPSRLIVDFFQQKGTTSEKPAAKKAKAKGNKVAQAHQLPGKKRTPASDALVVNPDGAKSADLEAGHSGIFDGGDPGFERFAIKDYEVKEDAIIASRQKVYLEFPMLQIQLPYFQILQSRPPVYEITPKDTEENKQARLLLTLFQNKRYNVYLKTADWFLEKFPQSEYDEMIRFMTADASFALWLQTRNAADFDTSMLKYRQALEKYPHSELAERTMFLMGFATLDRGDYLGTLRSFQNLLSKRPNSANRDIARFALADAYLKLRRFDEAAQIYREIEKEASMEKYKIEAAYRQGDVNYLKKDYAGAISEYQNALKKYPAGAADYPNAVYNQAAADFWLKDYRRSLDTYRDFLKKFPANEQAGYAMTRVGELLDILGADKRRVLGAYLETYFRYGETPSATVARLRMLSEKMNTMKPKEVEKAVADIRELAKKSELPKMDQFATLMIAEGYNHRQEYDKAVHLLIDFYQLHPTTADTDLLSTRIVKNINEELASRVNKGKFMAALELYNKYADNWLKNSSRIDTKYNVGHAYEQAGVFSQAEVLYKDTLNKIYAIKGTPAEKERSVFEKLPSEDQVNLRLSAIAWQQGKLSEAYDFLKAVKKPELFSDVEQIERMQIASTLLDKRGEVDSAIRYLSELLKAWSGLPHLLAEPYLHLAQLEIKKGDTAEAMKALRYVDDLQTDSKKVSPDTHAKALEMLADLQLQKKQNDDAVKTLNKLLDSYASDRPLASYRYKLGDIYFQKGENQKAAEVWNELKSEKNDFWYKLAQEQLQSADWKNEYRKYIQRIPAMSEVGERKKQ
jgi:tetratricopeptide (TPR) repeat protein